MFEGLVISSIFCAIGYLGWAHAEWRLRSRRLDADLALIEENAQLRRLVSSMTNHPSVRKTGDGFVMPVEIKRGSK